MTFIFFYCEITLYNWKLSQTMTEAQLDLPARCIEKGSSLEEEDSVKTGNKVFLMLAGNGHMN